MSGIFWHIFTFGAILISLVLAVYRILVIIRKPVHLRWELAPIPHERGRAKYGGSYLEEYEWWRKPRRHSRIAPIKYMLQEIFLMRGIWKNNRSLWPFSSLLHAGIYLFVITLFLNGVNAVFIITGAPTQIIGVFQNITSALALAGYLTGGLGAISLILKRRLDANYRPFTTPAMYFKLGFLAAVFISGIGAWAATPAYASETSQYVKNLITLDSGITATPALAAHIIISLLFIAYLPFTDMLHFIAKYFTHHAVRWDDKPLDETMSKKLERLITRPVSWSAPHAGSGKSWAEIASGKKDNAEKT
jgi:nitrate reductase gamma subunit